MSLEQEKSTDGVVETPSKEEKVEAPPKEEKPTLRKTYTEEEFKKAQSAWDTQITLAKEEAQRAKAEQESLTEEMQSLEKQLDELAGQQFADDPEAKRAYIDRRAIEDAQRKLAKREEEAERKIFEAEKVAWAGEMALAVIDAKSKHEIPAEAEEALDSCVTTEQVWNIAKLFPLKSEKAPEEPKPKFDSGKSTGGGTDFSKLSPDDKLKLGFRQLQK